MLRRTALSAALLGMSIASPLLADETVFPFNGEQFQVLFNTQSQSKDRDTIETLKKKKKQTVATFDDSRFKRDAKASNESAKLETELFLKTREDGIVTAIVVEGSRADPVNLAHTIRTIRNVYEILNPGVSDESEKDFIESLGLRRGDDDLTIGTPMGGKSSGGDFTCNNRSLDSSPKFGCVVAPPT